MDHPCPQCSSTVPDRATYCPRCGEQQWEHGSVGEKKAYLRRELIVGWILFLAGGAMVLLGIFSLSGIRSWMSVGLGIPLFVVGLGTLVGKPEKKKPK